MDGKKQTSEKIERRLERLIEAFAADRLSCDCECSDLPSSTFQSRNMEGIVADAVLCRDAPAGLRRIAVVWEEFHVAVRPVREFRAVLAEVVG